MRQPAPIELGALGKDVVLDRLVWGKSWVHEGRETCLNGTGYPVWCWSKEPS